MSDLDPVWKKLDTHEAAINALKANEMVVNHRLNSNEKTTADMCRQLIETRQEVVTLVNTKFDSISLSLKQVSDIQSEDRGAKLANSKTQALFFSVLAAIPTLAVIIGAFIVYHKGG